MKRYRDNVTQWLPMLTAPEHEIPCTCRSLRRILSVAEESVFCGHFCIRHTQIVLVNVIGSDFNVCGTIIQHLQNVVKMFDVEFNRISNILGRHLSCILDGHELFVAIG